MFPSTLQRGEGRAAATSATPGGGTQKSLAAPSAQKQKGQGAGRRSIRQQGLQATQQSSVLFMVHGVPYSTGVSCLTALRGKCSKVREVKTWGMNPCSPESDWGIDIWRILPQGQFRGHQVMQETGRLNCPSQACQETDRNVTLTGV